RVGEGESTVISRVAVGRRRREGLPGWGARREARAGGHVTYYRAGPGCQCREPVVPLSPRAGHAVRGREEGRVSFNHRGESAAEETEQDAPEKEDDVSRPPP